MLVHRKNKYSMRNNICMMLSIVMFIVGISISFFVTTELQEINVSNNIGMIYNISSIEQNIDLLVERNSNVIEQCEKQDFISNVELRARKTGYRTILNRVFLLAVISLLAERYFSEVISASYECITYYIIYYVHRSDGKKRISY